MSSWVDTYSLPERPLTDGFDREFQNNILRTNMDTGAAKVRLRYTAVPIFYTLQYILTTAQKNSFDGFYEGAMNYGSSTFTMPDPDDGGASPADITVRLDTSKGTPKIVPDGDTDDWRLTINIEKVLV